MSFSNLYSSGFKQRNRDHFASIVRIALSDGVISKEEEAFINRTAINLEIEEQEVETIKANLDNYPINPPSTEQRRLERLYDLARMVFADQIADEAEKKIMNRLIIGLGFPHEEVEDIINQSFEQIQKGSDEDEFVASFK
ncbi:TerB family tellurite resistance protein [Flavobacteriaceae bacterium]|jgi:uncharacterized tellurite resistance protein B-like protein|nr:TerB family tellurite resistance protein [Flavobacteriaceae bacterium]|tara:strand:+ start:1164 stop:1583 length:420 start_codon:yes stop_codon:yes gene_type:complete